MMSRPGGMKRSSALHEWTVSLVLVVVSKSSWCQLLIIKYLEPGLASLCNQRLPAHTVLTLRIVPYSPQVERPKKAVMKDAVTIPKERAGVVP